MPGLIDRRRPEVFEIIVEIRSVFSMVTGLEGASELW